MSNSQVWARRSAGRLRTKSGIHHSPVPSWPVASTSLRVARTSPVESVTSRHGPPSSSRPGAMAVAATSLRTGRPRMRRYHSRYSCQSTLGIRFMSAKACAPCWASYQAWKVRLGMPRSGPVCSLGLRSVGMRAKVTQGPSLPSGARSITRMLPTRSRIRPKAVTSPDWPAPTISTSSAGLPPCSRGTIHSMCGCAVISRSRAICASSALRPWQERMTGSLAGGR